MRFEVFGVDAKRLLELFDRSLELPFQEMETPDLVPHDAVPRIRLRGAAKMRERFVVEPLGLQRQSIEVVSFGQVGCARQSLVEHRLRPFGVAFLDADARDIDPSVGVIGVELRHGDESFLGGFEIALKQQANPVIVEAQ